MQAVAGLVERQPMGAEQVFGIAVGDRLAAGLVPGRMLDLVDDLEGADLNGKKVALFGCGDSSSYSDTFGDALGKIYEVIKNKGCELIGRVSVEGYTYDSSEAIVDGQFVGLLIDEDNESNLTDQRVALWLEDLRKKI